MFENEIHKHKEQSGSGWRLAFLLLLGGVIILGGGLLVAWQVSAHQVPQVASSSAGTTTAKGSGFPTVPVPLPSTYKEVVKQQVAQGLHLTVPQVQTKLRSEIDLFYVATDQH